ncbi:MAG TPA: radical SAM protein [Bacteroidales bacterium]|nr:radical SAM protein [Bacteroidales bacterium]
MDGFLFEQVVFGPIRSRRLGISLGVNLLPLGQKHCTFNCLYCECGWTPAIDDGRKLPEKAMVESALEAKLRALSSKNSMIDNITFAGNGEPTLHPEFSQIIDSTINLRKRYFPEAGIAVLSNGSMAGLPEVKTALLKVDQNILKLDAGTNETFQKINQPKIQITIEDVLENFIPFKGQMVIQSLFVRGIYNGIAFDNTTEFEIDAWLGHIIKLRPKKVMIYPIARATPAENIERIGLEVLIPIAQKVEAAGIQASVYA